MPTNGISNADISPKNMRSYVLKVTSSAKNVSGFFSFFKAFFYFDYSIYLQLIYIFLTCLNHDMCHFAHILSMNLVRIVMISLKSSSTFARR